LSRAASSTRGTSALPLCARATSCAALVAGSAGLLPAACTALDPTNGRGAIRDPAITTRKPIMCGLNEDGPPGAMPARAGRVHSSILFRSLFDSPRSAETGFSARVQVGNNACF
jgi:hypothetical protein